MRSAPCNEAHGRRLVMTSGTGRLDTTRHIHATLQIEGIVDGWGMVYDQRNVSMDDRQREYLDMKDTGLCHLWVLIPAHITIVIMSIIIGRPRRLRVRQPRGEGVEQRGRRETRHNRKKEASGKTGGGGGGDQTKWKGGG